MRRRAIWGGVIAACLWAGGAQAVQLFVPVPNLGGRLQYGTEFVREDVAKINVDFTFAPEGRSAVGIAPQRYKALPGPSTDRNHPLLTDDYDRDFRPPPARSEPKYYLPGGGLVVLQGETGLVGVQTAALIGGDPTSAWDLPMLTSSDAFPAGTTAWVQNLLQGTSTASQLSLYNLARNAARCQTRLLSADGQPLESRQGLAVPPLAAVRVADIVSKVVHAPATGLSVAVSCNQPFYALGSFPAAKKADIRVHYPSTAPPTLGTRDVFVGDDSFLVTPAAPAKKYTLPLLEGTRYRSLLIDFDVTPAAPQNGAYFRSVVGMWRVAASQRFGKTLYFGTVERFDRSKLMVDLGAPYIEILVKRSNAALVSGKTYHVHIEVNADQRSIRQLVTNTAGNAVVTDILTGLFSDDLATRGGASPIVGFGLDGIADGAYSPPYGWRFSHIVISGYR